MLSNLKDRLDQLGLEINSLTQRLDLPQKEQRLLELQEHMQAPNFWQDNERAQKVSQEYNQLKIFYDFWSGLKKNILELRELVKQNTDDSQETISYLEKQTVELEQKYKKNRFVALLSKKYDDHNAIFSVHAGAGGLDAQDWTEMLLRMFLRYCEKKGFITDIIESSKGQDGGVKSATVEVRGPYAYGLLKSEAGVHRLVRLSPYNPAHTRETSFALLELIPILKTEEEVNIDPKDLKIEVTTSSGHGGQSVNTTYSAVRMTHIPSGIKVSIQNERSQHQNREIALKIITAKVKALEEARVDAEKKQLRGEFKSAEWGNQIRSYVLHPYKLVKDHRTNFESTDPDSILNGELDEFVEAYLEKQMQ